jgi:hypothetical protein
MRPDKFYSGMTADDWVILTPWFKGEIDRFYANERASDSAARELQRRSMAFDSASPKRPAKKRMAMDTRTRLISRGEVLVDALLLAPLANDAAPAIDAMTFFNGRNYSEGKRLYDEYLSRNS